MILKKIYGSDAPSICAASCNSYGMEPEKNVRMMIILYVAMPPTRMTAHQLLVKCSVLLTSR